jgi:hypothetical protein
MTKEEREKAIWEKARNRWYALSMIFSEVSDEKVIKVAMAIGFASTDAMRSYFLRWGDKLVERYGKLPYCRLNSRFYDKYMELE